MNLVTVAAWKNWISVTKSRCHLHFALDGGTIESHVKVGLGAGAKNAERIASDVSEVPTFILEVGCSVGFNCIGLAQRFPNAVVYGIEPDADAVDIAENMSADIGLKNAEFLTGVGECLPFEDETFDLIVCHTVIEHVKDVDTVISEMARVLRPGGKIHLEAPNYIWPEEPHLRIMIPPICPKSLMRFLAVIQGKGADANYVDHLQLVYPGWVEENFRRNGLTWVNRVERKLLNAASGEHTEIVSYKQMARVLVFLRKIGVVRFIVRLAMALSLYPSILYTASKPASSAT